MENELKIDPKLVAEFFKFNKNMIEAPKMVSAPNEINLEMTPYDVAYSEDKIRLLHFNSPTQKQHQTPLVIVYALVNRYHILDIQPHKSWVRNLLNQGYDVYMIDWGTPSNIDKYLGFDDYVNGYIDNCVDFVCNEASVNKVSMQGYCTGGTLATVYTALNPNKIKNLIVTAPVIDGKRDTTVVGNLAKHMDVDNMVETIGNMPPEFMYYVFSVLKPFEQGIEKYINFFRNIDDKNYVDSFLRVEKWLNDNSPVKFVHVMKKELDKGQVF